jgi:small subunit ribosomal protein S8
MFVSDPIADLATRIRNAQHRLKPFVDIPASVYKAKILDVLQREGYIRHYSSVEKKVKNKAYSYFRVELKYYNQKPVIQEIKRVSCPSVHYHSSIQKLRPVANGLGNAILTTSKGVLSDREAREQNVGGKILIHIH